MLYGVETTDKAKHCEIQAKNIKLYRKFDDVKEFVSGGAFNSEGGDPDLRIGEFSAEGVAKVYDAKAGHEEYADALGWITKVHTEDTE